MVAVNQPGELNSIFSSGTVSATTVAASGTTALSGSSVNVNLGQGSQHFSKEVEDEANSYFQRIYNTSATSSAMTIDQIIEILKNLRDSPHDKDKVHILLILIISNNGK